MSNSEHITVELLYRCGGNYKDHFELTIHKDRISDLTPGQEREIEDFGISPSEMYELNGRTYDSELDHNLVDVIKVKNAQLQSTDKASLQKDPLSAVEIIIQNQVNLISKIVDRSTMPLSKNNNYLVQRGKFYGMLKIYQEIGGNQTFKIYEHGL